MKGLFKQWNKRNLTPIGKITVVKITNSAST